MPTIYLASHNRHKAVEIQAMLGSTWTVLSCQDLDPQLRWDETGSTFEANALIKAQALATGRDLRVLADDSGLEAKALNGAPGLYSARYAGAGASDRDNLEKLLRDMEGKTDRRARFVCVLCLLVPGEEPHFFKGACEGRLLEDATGKGGFGYDPIFVPDGYAQSFAELGDGIKNEISHRAKALQGLKDHLAKA